MKNVSISKNQSKLKLLLETEGFNEGQIEQILNCEYTRHDYAFELPKIKHQINFQSLLSNLASGVPMTALDQVVPKVTREFKALLKTNNLSVEEALSLRNYSTDSKEILYFKRTYHNNTQNLLDIIEKEFVNTLKEYKLNEKNIFSILKFSNNLNHNLSIYQCHSIIKQFLKENNLSPRLLSPVAIYVDKRDMLKYNLQDTIISLEKALKSQLAHNIVLYRAVKSEFLTKEINKVKGLKNIIGHKIEDNGFTSTSFIYENSFASNSKYPVVIEIYAPKGSQGVDVTPFSNYHFENEFLLNSNNLIVFDYNAKFIDKVGNKKILLRALLLSKEKECYNNIYPKTTNNETSEENE